MEGINAYRESILRAIPTLRNLVEKSEIPRGYRRDFNVSSNICILFSKRLIGDYQRRNDSATAINSNRTSNLPFSVSPYLYTRARGYIYIYMYVHVLLFSPGANERNEFAAVHHARLLYMSSDTAAWRLMYASRDRGISLPFGEDRSDFT